jgi:hypothetical protein
VRFLNDCEAQNRDLVKGLDLERIRHRLRALISDDRLRLDTEKAQRLQDRFRKDHEELAARYLTPEHAAILLAPPREQPVQPPIAPGLAFERMRAVFDADFARVAADEIEKRMQDETVSRLAADEFEKRRRDGTLARLVADEIEKRLQDGSLARLVADDIRKRRRDRAAAWVRPLRSLLARGRPDQRNPLTGPRWSGWRPTVHPAAWDRGDRARCRGSGKSRRLTEPHADVGHRAAPRPRHR